ncbi:iron(III) transport system ATP-binding protein [Gracilibacillus ureilyticus]|uniref:Iron(III) transport system ATP-binding protein n=1 Tax=Gracilibacillus ureilyticus TaxID=531814 RepID=A0A1H9URD8_9BACI|nr:ABC transporter ATP-binding protein [Gracilibacillus ureilyticus]SES11901.1 iron(III) transport system ATP-binding protein [Gracilibacillus ureilyticus]
MSIKISQLSKNFNQFAALKNIQLSIDDGEFIAILGPSGCGKTTLLRLLAGFLSPTYGKIEIGENEVGTPERSLPPEKRNIGMVFQSFALWPHLSVKEHIRFPILHHRFIPAELKKNADERIQQVLQMVSLEKLSDRMPNELSGGQRQRVALARAIAPKPELLLMDEPLSNLDAELRMEMRKEIQKIHRLTKATIVYVTHDQGEALAMADRIVVMNNGQVEQVGTPAEIYTRPKTPFVAKFVGKANLIEGRWENDLFTPHLSPDIEWPDDGVADEMKYFGCFPVRPEQLYLTKDRNKNDSITGIITSIQYQGKEIHYVVDVSGQEWAVHSSVYDQFQIGEQVFIHIKHAVRKNNLVILK